MPDPKPPQYVIELCKSVNGNPWKWKEYKATNTVNIVMVDGRKFTFPIPKKKPATKRRGKESDGKG